MIRRPQPYLILCSNCGEKVVHIAETCPTCGRAWPGGASARAAILSYLQKLERLVKCAVLMEKLSILSKKVFYVFGALLVFYFLLIQVLMMYPLLTGTLFDEQLLDWGRFYYRFGYYGVVVDVLAGVVTIGACVLSDWMRRGVYSLYPEKFFQ